MTEGEKELAEKRLAQMGFEYEPPPGMEHVMNRWVKRFEHHAVAVEFHRWSENGEERYAWNITRNYWGTEFSSLMGCGQL